MARGLMRNWEASKTDSIITDYTIDTDMFKKLDC